jgi:hypothetical protein
MSSEQKAPHGAGGQRWLFRILVVLILILAAANAWTWFWDVEPPPAAPATHKTNVPLAASFAGSSADLRRTVFVPTLESQIPEGKTAIWCASLLLAWRQLEKDVFKGPLSLEGAEEVSAALSKSPLPAIRPEDFYAAAGWAEDGIRERIQRELPERFPKAPLPTWETTEDRIPGAFAYAYLEAALRFTHKYTDGGAIRFQESGSKDGDRVSIDSFGIPEEKAGSGKMTYRKQVAVLFNHDGEFAVDLDRDSNPYQIIVACLKRPATLRVGLEAIELKTQKGKGATVGVDDGTVLLVPYLYWEIEHKFAELSRKRIRGSPLPDHRTGIVKQAVKLRLDALGAAIASWAPLAPDWTNGDEHPTLIFNRPFLLILKTRGQNEPIFACWIDNVELLKRSPPRGEAKP